MGTAPVCKGQPDDCYEWGMQYIKSDKQGDGKPCVTGHKVLCAPQQDRPMNQKRPFYIIGHDTNTLDKVRQALHFGANAIEIDVHRGSGQDDFDAFHGNKLGSIPPFTVLPTKRLANVPGSGERRVPLAPLLQSITEMDAHENRLGLVYFDFKDENGDPDAASKLLRVAREHLPPNVKVIVSVDSLSRADLLTHLGQLKTNEAVLVDEDNNVGGVVRKFQEAKITQFGYANGITVGLPEGKTRSTISDAIRNHRGKTDDVKFVFVWTIKLFSSMRYYLAQGVDGVIVENDSILDLRQAMKYFAWEIRPATRADDAF
jgi:hypothetical protein